MNDNRCNIKCYINSYYYEYVDRQSLYDFYNNISMIIEELLKQFNNLKQPISMVYDNRIIQVKEHPNQKIETNTISYNRNFNFISTDDNPNVLIFKNTGNIPVEEKYIIAVAKLLKDILDKYFKNKWDGQIEIVKMVSKKR